MPLGRIPGVELLDIMRPSYDVIREHGRDDDYASVLRAIGRKTLSVKNITLQLLLDIGSFLATDLERVSNVRYNVVTMKLWGTVYKLFKGKALRLFRGFMAGGPAADEGQSRQATFTDECQFNMVVPSSKSIRKYMGRVCLITN